MIDSHTHYHHKKFEKDRDEVLRSLPDAGIEAVIEAALDVDSNEKILKLCGQYPILHMAAGCHPNFVSGLTEKKFATIAEMAEKPEVIAIGETGLDHGRDQTEEERALQERWFRRFIELSIHLKKPLVIHCRDAKEDLIRILSEYQFQDRPGVIHCFSDDEKTASILIQMGFFFGIGGRFLKEESDSPLWKALAMIPAERLLLETDTPFLTPPGVEERRNTSRNLPIIAEELSKLRGVPREKLLDIIRENTVRLFALSEEI